MTELTTGRLAWGQAGSYDAADDRAVIAAVTRGRSGLVAPSRVAPGSGLEIIIYGGWLGVADCGDGTSAVVGTYEDKRPVGAPGPATGSRDDVVWCDTNPDEGTWVLSVIPRSASVGRPGIPLCWVTVPANANTAAQMQLTPVDSTLERRIVGWSRIGNDQSRHTAQSWATATGNNLATPPVIIEPGQWYRVSVQCNAFMLFDGAGREGRVGIGWRNSDLPVAASVLVQACATEWSNTQRSRFATCEWVFWHDAAGQRITRTFDTRCWMLPPGGTFVPGASWDDGDSRRITVEDMGS